MKLISKIKGYWRRLTSPKKDLNFKTKETQYGEILVSPYSYIYLKNIDTEYSKICIQIKYNPTQEDANSAMIEFLQLFNILQIQYIDQDKYIYIIGSIYDYIKLFCRYEYLKNDNKVFGLVYNLCKNINIIRDNMKWLEQTLYSSYNVHITVLSKDNPVRIYNPLDDMLNSTHTDIIPELLYIYIYDSSWDWEEYSFINFFMSYNNNKYFKEKIDELNKNYPTAFILPNGKNIIDMNFILNDSNASYDGVDEIID